MEAGRRLRESVAGHNRGGKRGLGGEVGLLGMRSNNSYGLGALSLISLITVTEGFNHMIKSTLPINTCDEAFVMIFLSSGLPGFGRGMESDVSVQVEAFAQFLNTASTPPHKTIRVFLGKDCRPACPD